MAFGQLQSGGLLVPPDVPQLGYEDWGTMSGIHPSHALVGGTAGQVGYGSAATRRVAIAEPGSAMMTGPASGAPMSAHWREVFNLKGNPIGWVLIAAVLYLGLMHIHVRAGASGGLGFGK